MRRFLPIVTLLVGVASGIAVTYIVMSGNARRVAERQQVVSALERVSTAQITLALLKQQRPEALEDLSMRTLTEGFTVANAGIANGVSLHDLAYPNLTESVRRASQALQEHGAPLQAHAQAAAVVAHLTSP